MDEASRAPAPWALTRVLDGPFPDFEAVVLGRIAPIPEACGDDPEGIPTDAAVTIVSRVDGKGPLLEAVSLRYPGDIACSPIEYCALALRSAAGWWLTPHDENAWCQGVTGPSSRVEIEYEDLDAPSDEPGLLVHRGIRQRHSREYIESFDGKREESWSTTEEHFEHLCQVTSDARAHCQR